MKIIRIIPILFLFMFIDFSCYSQESETNGYKLVSEKSGVNFYYQDIKDDSGEMQPLSIALYNTNNTAVEVEWVYHIWYNGNCRSCMISEPDNFYYKKMVLKPGSKKVLNYSSPDKDGLVLYKRYKNSFLTKIEFAQVKVTVINEGSKVKSSENK